MRTELGYCKHCGNYHSIPITGIIRTVGAAASIGGGVLARQPLLALGLSVVSLLFGDAIEARVKAQCPACGIALQLVRTITA